MGSIERASFDGVECFIMREEGSGLEAQIIPAWGAMLNRLTWTAGQDQVELVEGYNSLTDYQQTNGTLFKSAKLFPFTNRIPKGQYQLAGRSHQLKVNFPNEGNAIHGCVWNQPFQVESMAFDANSARMVLSYSSTGDEGYPFAYRILLAYELSEEGGLRMKTVIENKGVQTMPVGDGWHHYFKLGTESIDDLELTLDTDYTYRTENGIPVEKLNCDAFEQVRLSTIDVDKTHHLTGKKRCALVDPKSGRQLSVETQVSGGLKGYDFVHVYTPSSRDCIALEPVTCPANAFNSQDHLTLLQPKEVLLLQWAIGVRHININHNQPVEDLVEQY